MNNNTILTIQLQFDLELVVWTGILTVSGNPSTHWEGKTPPPPSLYSRSVYRSCLKELDILVGIICPPPPPIPPFSYVTAHPSSQLSNCDLRSAEWAWHTTPTPFTTFWDLIFVMSACWATYDVCANSVEALQSSKQSHWSASDGFSVIHCTYLSPTFPHPPSFVWKLTSHTILFYVDLFKVVESQHQHP